MTHAAVVCTIEGCTQKRRFGQTLALCDQHYLEYQRDIYWQGKAKYRNRRAKFNENQIFQILFLRSQGYSLKEIAQEFHTTWKYVSEISCGKKWHQVWMKFNLDDLH